MGNEQRQPAATKERNIGLPLGIGIFVAPYIFGWLTLQRGYSTGARIVSFAWMGVIVLAMLSKPDHEANADVAAAAPPATPATMVAEEPPSTPEPPPPEIRWMTAPCGEVAKTFGMDSDLTDLQKKAIWKQSEIEGAHFEWPLKVTSVDSTFGKITAQFKCEKSRAFTSDVILSVDSEETALKLRKGKTYKIHGTLEDWGNFIGLSGDLVEVVE